MGRGIGIYNVTVSGGRSTALGVGVYTFRGRFTPDTDLTKVGIIEKQHTANKVKYSFTLNDRDFEIVADTRETTKPDYPYQFKVSLYLNGLENALTQCIGFTFPNSSGLFAAASSSNYNDGYEYCYDVVDGTLQQWGRGRYFRPSCFPMLPSVSDELAYTVDGKNSCS